MLSLKKSLRVALRQQRRNLPIEIQRQCAEKIAVQLLTHALYQTAQHIAFYFAFDGEVSPQILLDHALAAGKHCYAPVLAENKLAFLSISANSHFSLNRYGIQEPCQNKTLPNKSQLSISPQDLDMVLVPLVAFDRHCFRLGMGGGFYDQTFAPVSQDLKSPKLIGLAYEFQCLAEVPKNSHDLQLDAIVTETQIYLPTY